jgi:hypothetical protein
MGSPADVVAIMLPRSIVPELPTFASALNDRMHSLLERNTEGTLSESERVELESFVQMAQFAQIFTTATQQPDESIKLEFEARIVEADRGDSFVDASEVLQRLDARRIKS